MVTLKRKVTIKRKVNDQVKEIHLNDYVKDEQDPNKGFAQIDEMAFFSDLRKLSGLY